MSVVVISSCADQSRRHKSIERLLHGDIAQYHRKGAHPQTWTAYLGNHILHQPRVQLEAPLVAVAPHAGVIGAAVTSIGMNRNWPRGDVFWTFQQRRKGCSLVAQVHQRLHTCVVWLGEEEIIRVLTEPNK